MYKLIGAITGFLLVRFLILSEIEVAGFRMFVNVLTGNLQLGEGSRFGSINIKTLTSDTSIKLILGLILGVFVGAMVKNKSKSISRIDDKDKGTQSITNQNIVVGIVILTALCIGLYFNKSNFVSDKISVNADVGVQSKFDELEQQNNRKQLFIESNFVNFSYAKLGGKVGEYFAGDKLEIDGGPYFFTKNKARINYSYDEKISYEKQGLDQKIIAIIFSCKESIFPISEGLASIDGVSCNSELSKLENSEWKKSCSVYSFNNLSKPLDILFTKNNAAIQVKFDEMSSPSIDQIGLYSDISRFNTGYRSCDEAEKLKYKAIQGGFKSLGDMMSK